MRTSAGHPQASASIIIPAYNAARTIRECLEALAKQTISPKEIIVVDDGSTDNTAEVVAQFPKTKLISQTNAGPARARNVGAKAAKGDIIIFLDSDCVPETNWLEEMLKPFHDSKVAGVQGAYQTKQQSIIARFDQLDIEYRYERMKRAQKLDWIGSYSAAYRRDIFLKEKGFDETFPKASGEDAELSYRLAEKKYRLVFAPHAIVYHTHPDDLWKYLKIKFFRAYWRMRMYVKFPQKIVADSYTPQSLKAGIVVGPLMGIGIGILSIIFAAEVLLLLLHAPLGLGYALYIISGIMLAIYLGGLIILLLSPGLLNRLMGHSIQFIFWGPIILLLRAIAFGLGMVFGLLDARVHA